MAPLSPSRLVLVGGGHAHLEVLRRFALAPPAARLSVVLDSPFTAYSGMAPGVVSGRYRLAEALIDAASVARRAGAEVIAGRLRGLDAAARELHLESGPALSYDVASLNLGSSIASAELPGVAAHATPARPLGRLLAAVAGAGGATGIARRIVVVGGGAAGVELAFALARRQSASFGGVGVALVHAGRRLVPERPVATGRCLATLARRRGIEVLHETRAVEAEAGLLRLDDGRELACDLLVWAAGARGNPALAGSGLVLDPEGFALVRPSLQAVGHDEVFASGDCASLAGRPALPKAGVHAVRQAPVLERNLRAWLEGRPLQSYRPQRDYLSLIDLSDATALASKWVFSARGRWAARLKEHIDRRFVARYAS
ncbi:MAG: FAD-dependent oxidoreductase [Vicinamibacteria bacterium]